MSKDLELAQSLVFQFIEQGKTPNEVQSLIRERGFIGSREQVSKLVWDAVRGQQLLYTPDHSTLIEDQATDILSASWNDPAVHVLHTESASQLANTAAQNVIEQVCQKWETRLAAIKNHDTLKNVLTEDGVPNEISHAEAIKIGIAPGRTPNLFALHFAKHIRRRFELQRKALRDRRLKNTPALLPRMIMMHTTCGVLASGTADSNPNIYPYYFRDIRNPVCRFVSLPVPGLLTCNRWKRYKKADSGAVEDSLRWKGHLDYLIMSAGHFGYDHSSLCDYVHNCFYEPTGVDSALDFPYGTSDVHDSWRRTMKALKDAGCIADVMWRPISKDGPINDHKLKIEGSSKGGKAIRVPTMFELEEVPDMISGKVANDPITGEPLKTKVILLLAPCGGSGCKQSKGAILSALSSNGKQYANEVFADHRTAQDFVDENSTVYQ